MVPRCYPIIHMSYPYTRSYHAHSQHPHLHHHYRQRQAGLYISYHPRHVMLLYTSVSYYSLLLLNLILILTVVGYLGCKILTRENMKST